MALENRDPVARVPSQPPDLNEANPVKYSPTQCARNRATVLHQGQMYGAHPYTVHLRSVWFSLLAHHFFAETYGVAAWLHDSLEDTSLTLAELTQEFGGEAAHLVAAVTTPHSIGNRKARFEVLAQQLAAVPEAVPLKLADRLAHVRQGPGPFLRMYKKEHPAFRASLFPLNRDGRVLRMWAELDRRLA